MVLKEVEETIEGQNIAQVLDSLEIILDGKNQLYVCKIGLKIFDIPEEKLLDGVEILSLMTSSPHMMERETLMGEE
jgi:predicted peroxiredoxin